MNILIVIYLYAVLLNVTLDEGAHEAVFYLRRWLELSHRRQSVGHGHVNG